MAIESTTSSPQSASHVRSPGPARAAGGTTSTGVPVTVQTPSAPRVHHSSWTAQIKSFAERVWLAVLPQAVRTRVECRRAEEAVRAHVRSLGAALRAQDLPSAVGEVRAIERNAGPLVANRTYARIIAPLLENEFKGLPRDTLRDLLRGTETNGTSDGIDALVAKPLLNAAEEVVKAEAREEYMRNEVSKVYLARDSEFKPSADIDGVTAAFVTDICRYELGWHAPDGVVTSIAQNIPGASITDKSEATERLRAHVADPRQLMAASAVMNQRLLIAMAETLRNNDFGMIISTEAGRYRPGMSRNPDSRCDLYPQSDGQLRISVSLLNDSPLLEPLDSEQEMLIFDPPLRFTCKVDVLVGLDGSLKLASFSARRPENLPV